MQAHLQNHGDVTIISISGALNIEETQPFRDVILRKFQGRKVIFNMEQASFVGSTGLQAFLETVQNMEKNGVRFVGVKSEVRRVISSLDSPKIEFFEDENKALSQAWIEEST